MDNATLSSKGSTGCICRECVYWWSSRCPYGKCYDDYRAEIDPYTDHFPERHHWSDSHLPGEQQHWCRGGATYLADHCEHFVRNGESKIVQCLKANLQIYSDGYMECPIIDNVGCEACYKDFLEKDR